jgi:hypothetical protein
MTGVQSWPAVGYLDRALEPADVQPGEVREVEKP